MSEELYQHASLENMISIGEYKYLNIGRTSFADLLNKNIISNSVKNDYLFKEPDGLILSGKSMPYRIEMIIENKKPEEFKKETVKNKAREQVVEYCYAADCRLCSISDGNIFYFYLVNPTEDSFLYKYYFNGTTVTCNPIKYENNTIVKLQDIKGDKESQFLLTEIVKSIDVSSSVLKLGKVIANPSELAKKVWQSIWLATGDDPKSCLMTFTEIFMYKYLSDLNIIQYSDEGIDITFSATLEKGKTNCLKFYTKNVRSYIKKIFPPSLEDETTIINGLSLKTDRNQDELFYKILMDFKEFGSLKGVSVEFKSSLFEEFLKGSNGIKLMAQFFTPRNIVRAMVDMAQVYAMTEGQSICDPACGVGGFIQEAIIRRNVREEFSISDTFSSSLRFYGEDMDQHTIILAKASLTVLLSDYIYEYRDDVDKIAEYINKTFKSMHRSTIGSLSNIRNQFDLVLSNPPYVRKGLSVYHEFIDNNPALTSFYDTKTSSKEGLFVINIVKSLKPGGRAFVILPDGFFHTKSDKDLRQFVLENCFLDAIISLPARTFYTTAKKTYILCITKKRKSSEKQDYAVFNYILRDVGESLDAVRMDTNLDDINTLVIEFRKFKTLQKNYEVKDNSRQIFLQEIDYYAANNMWMCESLITDSTKKELGIKEEEDLTEFDDVLPLLEEMEKSFSDVRKEIETIENQEYRMELEEVSLGDEQKFRFHSATLGLRQKEYKEAGVSEADADPVYTAASKPVAYFEKDSKKYADKLLKASADNLFVSVATDGDGTAGTNIMLHSVPFYINTSRLAIEILDRQILPEYLYYCMKSIKKKFGFGYTVKCNKDNFIKYFTLRVPVDEKGEYSVDTQKQMIQEMKKKEDLLKKILENEDDLKLIRNYAKYLAIENE